MVHRSAPRVLSDLPPPDDLPTGDPEAPAAPPGAARFGDVRSMRGRGRDGACWFALVYCAGSVLVMASGRVGERGIWFPTSYASVAAAQRAYTEVCASLVDDGYDDVRD